MRQRPERPILHLLRENTSNQKAKRRIERDLCKLNQSQKLEEAKHRANRTANLSERSKPTGVEDSEEPYVTPRDYLPLIDSGNITAQFNWQQQKANVEFVYLTCLANVSEIPGLSRCILLMALCNLLCKRMVSVQIQLVTRRLLEVNHFSHVSPDNTIMTDLL